MLVFARRQGTYYQLRLYLCVVSAKLREVAQLQGRSEETVKRCLKAIESFVQPQCRSTGLKQAEMEFMIRVLDYRIPELNRLIPAGLQIHSWDRELQALREELAVLESNRHECRNRGYNLDMEMPRISDDPSSPHRHIHDLTQI